MTETFYGPWLKIERADMHIGELEKEFLAHQNKFPDGVSRHIDLPTGLVVEKFGGSFSRHTPSIIGDAIHNLRASLDHAFCILVRKNKNDIDRRTAFPFSDNEGTLKKGFIDGREDKLPSSQVMSHIMYNVRPYKGTDIYGIHDLDITDKHKSLLPTISTVVVEEMTSSNGNRITNCEFEAVANHDPRFFGGAAMMATRRLGDPNQLRGDFSGKICFAYGSPFAGKEIVPTLKYMRHLVAGVLQSLQPFIT